jgi:hypothetical protein
MSNCNAKPIKSTNLTQKTYSQFNILDEVTNYEKFVVWQETIEKSFFLYLNKDNKIIKFVTLYIILQINTTDLKDNLPKNDLPKNDLAANEFIKLNLLTNIKLTYNKTDPIQKIKIDKQILYDFIFKLYNIKQKTNDNYDHAFNYITEINTIGISIMQKIKGDNSTKNHKFKIEDFEADLKADILSIKDKIKLLFELTYPITDTETMNKISTNISLKIVYKQLSSINLSSNLSTINLHSLYPFLIKSVNYDKLKNFIIKKKYNNLIDSLDKNLYSHLITMLHREIIKGKPFNTTASNTALGHLGRNRLSHATYLLAQQLSQQQPQPPAAVILNGGRRSKQTKQTKQTKRSKQTK